jgi:tricarballylate dehydrogenase
MFGQSKTYDVLVVGGGNAGLCAAIMARQRGASVLLLEQAPRELRGGNTRHARNLRLAHDKPSAYLRQNYPADEYRDELARVSGGTADENLACMLIEESAHIADWMEQCGVRFQTCHNGRSPPARKTAFLLGGGKALLNAYYLMAQSLGIDVLYRVEVLSLRLDDEIAREVTVVAKGVPGKVHAKSVIVSSGGCQANIDWLEHHWGEAADHLLIRGTPYAQGQMLRNLLDQEVVAVGDPAQCHMVAVDGRAPKFDGGIVTRLDGAPFGIVVDRNGQRFHDEGEEIGPKRYAIWGRLVAKCPGQIAYSIFDATAERLFRPSIYPPIRAQTIAELAAKLSLDPTTLVRTVREFNNAVCCPHDGNAARHGRTEGLTPRKSRWALPIAIPPFSSYPLRPGITFSYLGVKVDEHARVVMVNGRPAANLFAAGAIMAANVLGQGYLAGIGLTIGAVFGRIAGRRAADYASQQGH